MRILFPQLKTPPKTEQELIKRCQEIEGLTFSQLAALINVPIPPNPDHRKGWVGGAIEMALGTDAGNSTQPDFTLLQIELKTIPLNHLGMPSESTFITSIPLLHIHLESWHTSQCYKKIKRILWVPIEGDKSIEYPRRRIGKARLWTPNEIEEQILSDDWHDLTDFVRLGKLSEINASYGKYLQIRPKAANAKALCYGFDETGNKILTLPRGFYLRSSFTATLL